jgi:biopolymer transport protein ExbB/TolQ
MKTIIVIAAAAMLAGCGADVAESAVTAARLRKQELENGAKTMQRAQEKVRDAMQQEQQRADRDNNEN